MSKVILRGNQEVNLLLALDIAVASYEPSPYEDADWRKSRETMEALRNSIEKQLGYKQSGTAA